MISQVTKLIVFVLATLAETLVAGEGWPQRAKRAWLIVEAKVVGEDKGDPAVEDNLLLLIGEKVYIAVDQNTANGHDYSAKPMLLEKGFKIEGVTRNDDTMIALASHKEGKRKLILTPSSDDEYLLRITFTEKVPNKYTLHMALKEVDQDSAKNRLKHILTVGELQGTIQMSSLNDWLARE